MNIRKVRLTMKLKKFKCERCEHEWIPRIEHKPRLCPKCKSPYWDTPRSNKLQVTDDTRKED